MGGAFTNLNSTTFPTSFVSNGADNLSVIFYAGTSFSRVVTSEYLALENGKRSKMRLMDAVSSTEYSTAAASAVLNEAYEPIVNC